MRTPTPGGGDLPPIPFWEEKPNWQRLPINENGEPLIRLPSGGDTNIVARADYADAGMPGALPTIYVREGVARRLQAVAERVRPLGLTLVVFDAYRPLSVQKYLFDNNAARTRQEQPHLSEDEVHALVRRFVAYPSSDPLCPPPHLTGAAVDVYLINAVTGVDLPMGTEPDDVAEATPTQYYELNPEEPFTANRRLLFHTMTDAGFTNYHDEWWHYDFGNQRWANIAHTNAAIYGIPADPA